MAANNNASASTPMSVRPKRPRNSVLDEDILASLLDTSFYEESEYDDSDRDHDYVAPHDTTSSDDDDAPLHGAFINPCQDRTQDPTQDPTLSPQPGTSAANDPMPLARSRNPSGWAKSIAKTKKNLGQEYTSHSSKKVIAKKVLGPPCKDNCFEKVGAEGVQAIFENFWKIGDVNLQNGYLAKCIRARSVARKRARTSTKSRSCTYEYIVTFNFIDHKVCRPGFQAMHGLGKGKIEYIMKNKQSPTGITIPDLRGLAPPPNKIVGQQNDLVHEHIRKLPALSSHYGRVHAPNCRYLEWGMTLKKVYDRYCDWLMTMNLDHLMVTRHYYRDVFKTYNIKMAPARTDTCSKCDTLKAAISLLQKQGLDLTVKQEELSIHSTKAKLARSVMNSYMTNTDPLVEAIVIDLQQTLPVPRISTGVSFYKCKLWCYNLGIVDLKSGKSYMHVWDETVAGRGSCEVVSCIFKWLETTKQDKDRRGELSTLVVFADNCAGQNKNVTLVASALKLIHNKTFDMVQFKYLVSGHSFLPCDSSFGLIEKQVRLRDTIYSPKGYINCMKIAKTPPFIVTEMTTKDFLNHGLLQTIIAKRRTANKQFSQAAEIRVSSEYPQGYSLLPTHSANSEECTKVRLMRGKQPYSADAFDLSSLELPLKNKEARKLDPKKLKDLKDLLSFYGDPLQKDWLEELLLMQQVLLVGETNATTVAVEDAIEEQVDQGTAFLDYYPLADNQQNL